MLPEPERTTLVRKELDQRRNPRVLQRRSGTGGDVEHERQVEPGVEGEESRRRHPSGQAGHLGAQSPLLAGLALQQEVETIPGLCGARPLRMEHQTGQSALRGGPAALGTRQFPVAGDVAGLTVRGAYRPAAVVERVADEPVVRPFRPRIRRVPAAARPRKGSAACNGAIE